MGAALTPARIRTARLALVPLAVADADEMVVVLGDAAMYRYTGGAPPTLEELRRRYTRMVVGRSPDGGELWACIHPAHAASSAVAAGAGLLPTDEIVDGEVVWRASRAQLSTERSTQPSSGTPSARTRREASP